MLVTFMTSDGKTYYELLQVARDASPIVIDASFRALMKIHHPDRGGDNGRTKDLIEARRILLDPTLRATYDRQLQVMDQRRAPAPTPPPRPASPMPLPRKFDTPDPDAGAEAHEQMKRQIGRALEILGPFVLIIILVGLALLALSGVLVK